MAVNEMFTVVHTMADTLAGQANGLVDRIKAATSDVGKKVHEFRSDPETPYEWIRKEQVWLEKANQNILDRTAELDKRIEAELVKSEDAMSAEDIVAAKAEYATVAKGYKNALKMVVDIPGYNADDFADVTPLKTLAGGTSGAATGTRRVRLAS